MDKESINRSCITNMEEKDPIINKYMNEYMKNVQEFEDIKGEDKLIVNFDITYPDGRCENFTCNGISEVFGSNKNKNDNYKQKSIDENKMKEHEDKKKKKNLSDKEKEIQKSKKCSQNGKYYCEDENYNKYDYIQNEYADFFDEYKKNFQSVKSNKNEKDNDSKMNCQDDEMYEKTDIEEHDGKINVYAYLGTIRGIELKGVSINLYKINGICPELVECKKTDSNGKVCFENIKEGSYRIIELIDKNYFCKPTYVNWNEVNVTKDNKCFTIYAINKMK